MRFRIKYLVYPQFQYALLLANIIVNLMLFSFLAYRIQHFFNTLLSTGKSIGLSEDHIYFRFIHNQRGLLLKEFLICLVVSLFFSSLFTLKISHKLAGPLIRLRNHLKETAENGTYRSLTFRKGDYFDDFPENLNKAFESVKNNESK
jgi:hypothetical protein